MLGKLPIFADILSQRNLAGRFRGFMPVIIDIETGGTEPSVHALLEIGAVFVDVNTQGQLEITDQLHFHVKPAQGALLDQQSLNYIKMDPYHPLRMAVEEGEAIDVLFQRISDKLHQVKCQRAVMVAHNAWFDLHAINAAVLRSKRRSSPFHSFTTIDTASLGALLNGQTVLAKICREWGIEVDPSQAHSAMYDAQITAQLFCAMVNAYSAIGEHLPQGTSD